MTVGRRAASSTRGSTSTATAAWLDPGEQIAVSAPVTPGLNQIVFTVPAGLAAGPTFARVRFSSAGGLAPTGPAADGEVEDYLVQILPQRRDRL